MAHRPSETLFQTACDLCKMPFPSLLRRQEPSLKRSFSCRANSRHQYENNQIFDFIKNLFFLRMHEASKALLCTGHPPARVRQISGFAKISACVFYEDCGFHAYDYAAKSAACVPTQFLRSFTVSAQAFCSCLCKEQNAVGTISAA